MATHLWTLLCERASIDPQTNTLSIFNVIEGVEVNAHADGPPPASILVPVNWSAVSMWTRSNDTVPETMRGKISIVSPSGQLLGGGEFVLDLEKNIRMRAISQIAQLSVQKSGTYGILIEQHDEKEGWKNVMRVPLDIVVKIDGAKQL